VVWAADDLAGCRFGRLTVLGRGENTPEGKARWICVCDCRPDKEKLVRAVLLKNGRATSCGCFAREKTRDRSVTHDATGSPEWETWRRMRSRCYNKRNDKYKYYGGRGIRVCARWRSSFQTFLEDMGPRPSDEHSIERKRVNDDYQPDNCIWATIDVQNRNKRSNVILEHDGVRKTVAEWARDLGVSQTTLHDRLRRGWSVADTVTKKKWEKHRWQTG